MSLLLWIHYNLGSLVWPSQTALSKLWALPFFGAPFPFHFVFTFFLFSFSFVVSQYYFIYLFIYYFHSSSDFLQYCNHLLLYFYLYIIIYFLSVSLSIFFCFCFIDFIQASFLLFSLHFTFTSVPISFFRLHCSISTRLQAPQISFSCTQNS